MLAVEAKTVKDLGTARTRARAPPSCYAMDRGGWWMVARDRNLRHKAANKHMPMVAKEIKQKEPLETPDAFPRVFHTTLAAWK